MQVHVNRELKLLARNCGRFIEPTDFLAAAVDEGSARAILSHQDLVILLFHSRDAHHVARVVELELGLVEHGLGNFADVADQMRHKAVARIQAAVRHDGVEFRKLVLVSLYEGEFVGGDVVFEENGLILRHRHELADALANLTGVKVQPLGDDVGVRVQVATRIA